MQRGLVGIGMEDFKLLLEKHESKFNLALKRKNDTLQKCNFRNT